jgi:hypothetical protein
LVKAFLKVSGIWVFLFHCLVLYICLRQAASFRSQLVDGGLPAGGIYFYLIIPILTFYTWLFLVALFASDQPVGAHTKVARNLMQSYAVLTGYVILFRFLWSFSVQRREAFVALMTFHFIASLCGLYIVVRTAKSISHLELNRPPRFREYGKLIGLIFLSWIFHP